MSASPGVPSTVIVPALVTDAVPAPVAVSLWPPAAIARPAPAAFDSVATPPVPLFRISEPPVQDIAESLVSAPAVKLPPDITKSPAVLVRLCTLSLPALCSTCGWSAKSIRASLPAPGTAPPAQRVGSSKLPAASISQPTPATWKPELVSSNTVPELFDPPVFAVPNRSPAASATREACGNCPLNPLKLASVIGVLA